MKLIVRDDPRELGRCVAADAATCIREALTRKERAHVVFATGASQFAVLEALTTTEDVDWGRVVGFHLDEYLELPRSHPASFRRYLEERLVSRVPLAAFHYVDGEAADPEAECDRLGALISGVSIDLALIGIGENGHIAFNDPPADLQTERPYLVVELDEACRRQQTGEGWFATLEDVPRRAISMSVRQILKADTILCTVPDARKAVAVAGTVEGPMTADVPASVLQCHPRTTLYLDPPAAARLKNRP
jgi:glucosamine-6-phosphate deaminase